MIVAETAGLRLRRLTLGDAPFLRRLLNEPSWLQNIGDRGVRTLADAQRYIETKTLERYRTLGFGMYLVESKADGQPMGVCGLVKRDTLPDADLGFALVPEFWGRGHAAEAASAVMEHAWRSLKLPRLLAIVGPDNAPSIKLLGKIGFRAAGTFRLPAEQKELQLYAAEPSSRLSTPS